MFVRTASGCCLILLILKLLHTRYRKDLRDIPGPLVASFSNIWKVLCVYQHANHRRSIEVHKKYGNVVRIGPKHVSFASPNAMHIIHGGRDAFAKSDFYKITSPLYENSPLYHLFSAQDIGYHTNLKKNVGGLYTHAAVAEFEPQVDMCVRLMLRQLSQRSTEGSGPLDMSMWLHLYACDSLCAINVSKTFGFLEAGKDVQNLIARGDYIMYLFGLYSQSPALQQFNAWLKWIRGLDKKNPLLAYTSANLKERQGKQGDKQDMLGSFLALHNERPDEVSVREATGAIYINLMAGHDVLATTLRAIFYYLAQDLRILSALRSEILDASRDLSLDELLPYQQLTRLPYLDAVVHEALRVHANTGMILERVVPTKGAVIDGYFLPGGTIVGCNAWVLHRNKDVFGKDVDKFRPERWLDAPEQQVARMKRNLFSFGAGPRMCIGRNIAWLQILKLVAEFYRRFDAKLAHPERPWKVDGSWVTTQTDMDMVVETL